jgi:hypothetical protein
LTDRIHLDQWDNITTVRERLEATESGRVLLVIPARCRSMRSLVNLRLLGRHAEDLRIRLRVIAEDLTTRSLARDAGLSTAPVFTLGLGGWSPRGLGGAFRPGAAELRARRRQGAAEGSGVLIAIGVVVVVLGIILASLVVFLPTATITLAPVSQPVSGGLDIVAEWGQDEVDYGRALVPARLVEIEVEGRHEIPATGVMDVAEGYAQGEAVFANRTSDPLIIPKGTIVRTGSGVNVRFFTVSDVELPAQLWGHARVGIVAMEPGPSGNVKALTINAVEGPLEFVADALNDAPTSGGTMRRVAIVAGQDYDYLRATLLQRLQQEAYSSLVEQLGDDEFIPPESLEVKIVDDEFDQALGQRTEVLSGRMLVNVAGLAVDGQGANSLLIQLMSSKIPSGYCLQEDTLRFRDEGEMEVRRGTVRFTRVGSGRAMSCVDEEGLAESLRGKTLNQASEYLQEHLELEEAPSISVIPSLYGRIPLLPQRTEIVVAGPSE